MARSGLISIAAISLTLGACGGSDAGFDPGTEPGLPLQPQLGGIWEGTITDGSPATPQQVIIFTTEEDDIGIGELRLWTFERGLQAAGSATTDADGGIFAGSATLFNPLDFFLGDNTVTEDCDFDGTFANRNIEDSFTAQSTLTGAYQCEDGSSPGVGTTGVFSASFSSLYERPTTVADFAGIWTSVAPVESLSLTIAADGGIEGSLEGCIWSGSISELADDGNLYELAIEQDFATCGTQLTGTYNGLVTLDVVAGAPDRMLFQIDNGINIFTIQAQRNQ